MNILNRLHKHIIAPILGLFVFIFLASAVDSIWFREDDIGTIVNGLVYSQTDFIKVMSTDDRNCICPANYVRSKPNLFSGFLRPLQHFLFSLLYPLIGLNAYAYFIVHVGLHALNVVLLFWLLHLFMPVGYALIGALFYGFYPDVTWLTWAATMQNSLCNGFLFLTAIAYCHYYRRLRYGWAWLGGLFFFVSLLARENGILVPFWAVFAVAVISVKRSIFDRFIEALKVTTPLFVVFALYWGLRLWAFGIDTLMRTVNNMVLRFPLLARLLTAPQVAVDVPSVNAAGKEGVAQVISTASSHRFWEVVQAKICFFIERFFVWTASLTMLDPALTANRVFMIILLMISLWFLIVSYKGRYRAMWLFIAGTILMGWPGVVAYPCPRYLNSVYPCIAVLFSYGFYRHFEQKKSWHQQLVGCMMGCILFGLMIVGGYRNRQTLYHAGLQQKAYQKPFDDLFRQHSFPAGCDRVLVIGTPFLSDIASIIHYYCRNLSLSVAHEPFATLAEQGVFGCNKPYRIKSVQSEIMPIPQGFRLLSHDPEHCAWWMDFSDHPLRWDPHNRAYIWSHNRYVAGIWYPCSVGRFCIHKYHQERFIVDMSIIIDKQWLNDTTAVISWDTMHGHYHYIETALSKSKNT
jgi:hypothetical protein